MTPDLSRPDVDAAPGGTTWVCGACGKAAKSRMRVGDESCWMHAVLCYDSSIERRPDGRVCKAKAVQAS